MWFKLKLNFDIKLTELSLWRESLEDQNPTNHTVYGCIDNHYRRLTLFV
jgi:hypothetical protein